MAGGETGYYVLRDNNLAPDVDAAVSHSWSQTLATLDAIITAPAGPKTLALDALTGFERQCQEYVCTKHFNNEWGDRGFGSYAKGFEMTAGEWIQLLAKLDQVRAKHGSLILLLSHCKIRPFKNPEGPDYDRYASNVHEKVWDATKQWADAVLFGNFYTTTLESDAKKKSKAVGGDTRMLYTSRTAAYDAKNRYGMDALIELPSDPSAMWSTIESKINRSKI